jgi:ORF6N domain
MKLDLDAFMLKLREARVVPDLGLAALYSSPVKRLNEQVERNKERFPEDLLFQL